MEALPATSIDSSVSMDEGFDQTPKRPRTPSAFTPNTRRRPSTALGLPSGGAHTPRTPYATVHKARMITSTIRKRRRQNQLDEVMTPHAIRARQTLAATPGRKARLEDMFDRRVSPRDELRMLSRVLAREKVVRERREETIQKEQQQEEEEVERYIEATPPHKVPEPEESVQRARSEELAVEKTPIHSEEEESNEALDETPTRKSNRTPGSQKSSAKFVIRSGTFSPGALNQSFNRSLNTSQFDIEMPRNNMNERLSLGDSTRLSELFPEFNLTQQDSEEDEGVGRLFPHLDFEEIKRNENNPFVIEVSDENRQDVSQVPDDAPQFTVAEGNGFDESQANGEPEQDINEGLEATPQPPNSAPDEPNLATEEDYEVYSNLIDDTAELGPIEPTSDFDPHANNILSSGLEDNEEPSVRPHMPTIMPVTERAPRPRPTIPGRIIKDLAASMTNHKLNPAALEAILDASEEFFQQASTDLAAYAKHGKRKTIDFTDVLQLMQRQRAIPNVSSTFTLAKKYLPQELVDEITEGVGKVTMK